MPRLDSAKAENRVREPRQLGSEDRTVEDLVAAANLVYTVNLADDSFELLRCDRDIKGNGLVFGVFSEAVCYFLDTIVKPCERKRMCRELDYDHIRERTARENSYVVDYFAMLDGVPVGHEMRVVALGGDRVAIGFARKDLEVILRRISEMRFDENFALFVVDLDTEMVEIIKNDGGYRKVARGDSLPYQELFRGFAEDHIGETNVFFQGMSNLAYVRKEFATEDKRAFAYRSSHLEGKWVDVTCFVIERHEDGTPAIFTIGFSMEDSKGTDRLEEMWRLKEDMNLRSEQALRGSLAILQKNQGSARTIAELLAHLGEFHGADRAYIFEYRKDGATIDNTYEWCRDGVAPMIDRLQNVPASEIAGWKRAFEEKGAFCMDSLKDANTTESGRETLAMQGIESLIAAPILKGGEIVGFIGVDNPTLAKQELRLLGAVATVAYGEILKRKEDELWAAREMQALAARDRMLSELTKALYGYTVRLDLEDGSFRVIAGSGMDESYAAMAGAKSYRELCEAMMARVRSEYRDGIRRLVSLDYLRMNREHEGFFGSVTYQLRGEGKQEEGTSAGNDASWEEVNVAFSTDESGHRIANVFGRDVTAVRRETVRHEREMKAARARDQILSGITAALYGFNVTINLVRNTFTFFRGTGMDAVCSLIESFDGRPYTELADVLIRHVPEEDRMTAYQVFGRDFLMGNRHKTGHIGIREFPWQDDDGRTRRYEVNGFMAVNESGEPIASLLARDVTGARA